MKGILKTNGEEKKEKIKEHKHTKIIKAEVDALDKMLHLDVESKVEMLEEIKKRLDRLQTQEQRNSINESINLIEYKISEYERKGGCRIKR